MIEPNESWLDVRRFVATSEHLADWSYARQAPYITESLNRQTYEFFFNAFGYLISAGVHGDYHEFGCFSARTFRMALSEAARWGVQDMEFWAYDSFCGLPEPVVPTALEGWVEGAMAMSQEDFVALVREQGVNVEKVHIVPGYYAESLRPEVLESGRRAAFINVDCDLRESAESVFEFILPIVGDGTLIYIDDYYCGYGGNIAKGVAGAYAEFVGRTELRSEPFLNVGFWGKSFIVYR